MLEEIGKIVEKYLDSNENWKRSQLDFCKDKFGDGQGCEIVWRNEKKGYSIVHSQNYKTPGHMSFHAPRHVWRIGGIFGKNDNWSLSFTYGIAPF